MRGAARKGRPYRDPLFFYRSLIHEVGHLVHYQREVEIPARGEDDETMDLWEQLDEQFTRRAQREREDFAHRYAETWRARLEKEGVIPFDRLADPETIRADGLDPRDFGLQAGESR